MEAEEKIRKIRTFVFICLAIAIIETVFGLTIMYAGMVYKEFDTKNAQEMFDLIKESNVEYYEKLVNSKNRSYMLEFEKLYTKRGNRSLINLGIILMLFSVFSLIPVLFIMFIIQDKKEESEKEEPAQEEKPGEEEETTV